MGPDGKFRVGISGSYGGLNIGDEAILQSIITQLRATLPVEITVFTRDVEDTMRRHRVERALPVRRMTRAEVVPEVERLDLFILGGGGILFDSEAEVYLREAEVAQQKGVPVMVYAVSAGPLQRASVQRTVRDVLSGVDVVTVRERMAKKALEDAGVRREIIVTADPSLLLKPEPLQQDVLEKERLHAGHRLIGMSVREPGPAAPDIDSSIYQRILADAADFMIDRLNADIILIPMERNVLDMQHSHAVISRMLRPQHAWVLKGEYTAGQLLTLMGQFDFAVGMRLHFLIFAALQGVPFVALPYAEKVSGLLDDLHVRMPPLSLVSAGRLIAYIDQSWDEREELRARINQLLPRLRERALENNRLAVGLLTRRAGGRNR